VKSDLLRDKFLKFFKEHKHKIVDSDSLVPKDDPTVLFTPAGMSQFKEQFLGHLTDFRRAASSQRCLRTDDLDKVGKTTGHHTFFEMLGNFSFGDYFKKEAISWAWQFLTEELKIQKDKLWVSVYRDDQEAYDIWRNIIGIPGDRIIKLGDKDNFWPSEAKEKGPNGPCGPCSEIFFDFGKDQGCKSSGCDPSCDCGRFVEVWNLVFTQFNRKEGGILEPLPQKNIDTGMGLERLAAVMQGAANNFETDLFKPLTNEIKANICSSQLSLKEQTQSTYAIADHIRAISFAIYDGVMPSNEARGYVIRKMIRKSSLYLNALGIKKPFLHKLVAVLAEVMQGPYPELKARRENIAQIILAEEKSFIDTINSCDIIFKEEFEALLKKPDPVVAGRIAFKLYDTHGIPLELTKEWLKKQAVTISQESFDSELLKQKNRSKLKSAMKGDVFINKDLALGLKETKFLGYQNNLAKAKIVRIISGDNQTKKITSGQEARIILDKTVFYSESGGQVGDSGEIIKGKNIFEVIDTYKIAKAIVHIGKVKSGVFKNGDFVNAKINLERRLSIARNHTATHLLQAALRKVLGAHVKQQGSLVAPDRLRFDFTHFKALESSELDRIEELVNEYILSNFKLRVKNTTLAAAKKSGALAFFKEKYESKVRCVAIADISSELCGGTHLDFSGEVGLFKIVQEGSVASGIRRIEAVTGKLAYQLIKEEEALIKELSSLMGAPRENLIKAISTNLTRLRSLEKQLHAQKLEDTKLSLGSLLDDAESINGIKFISKVFADANIDLLRKTVDEIKKKVDNAIIALGASDNGRALLVMGITEGLCDKGLDASKLIRQVSALIGGSGGGRKDFAQAGGNRPEELTKTFQELKKIIGDLK
jgi:alanyl-tRNA synthetase